ncbi:MAG: hypothetical protein HY868_03640 [Chloroflexi bacterium]|nr:hypothetical protein [Chloroflexota bacterium]
MSRALPRALLGGVCFAMGVHSIGYMNTHLCHPRTFKRKSPIAKLTFYDTTMDGYHGNQA